MARDSGRAVLSCDIGGTHANFGIVGFRKGRPRILLVKHYETLTVKGFPELVNYFLEYAKGRGVEPREACLAVAGRVEADGKTQRVRMTNAGLTIDSAEIVRKSRLKSVLIINDFEALAYATSAVTKRDCVTLNKGQPDRTGTRAVIGAGTGLGKALLCHDEDFDDYIPVPSEGGHSDLPLLSEDELRLSNHIRKEEGIRNQLSYEDVLSGRGLERIYRFLSLKFGSVPKELPADEISGTLETNRCSRASFEWLVRFFARCARNYVLDTLPTGGLFIVGGIAARNPRVFSRGFEREFVRNERFSRLLKRVPVCLVTNYNISLLGAALALEHQRRVGK